MYALGFASCIHSCSDALYAAHPSQPVRYPLHTETLLCIERDHEKTHFQKHISAVFAFADDSKNSSFTKPVRHCRTGRTGAAGPGLGLSRICQRSLDILRNFFAQSFPIFCFHFATSSIFCLSFAQQANASFHCSITSSQANKIQQLRRQSRLR